MDLLAVLRGEEPGVIRTLLHYRNPGQFGEYAVRFALTHHNLKGELVVLSSVYLPWKGKTSEADLVMVHEKGIFVFESKNYSGWIYGGLEELNWTQVLKNGEKHLFYNPVRQNRTHIRALAAYLKLPVSAFTSCVVFSERCALKKVPDSTADLLIVRRPDLLKRLRRMLKALPGRYTREQIREMAEQLRPLCQKSAAGKRKHVEDIRTKCPFCGSPLVLRKGMYGVFWGCSAYPKCRFTRPEKE